MLNIIPKKKKKFGSRNSTISIVPFLIWGMVHRIIIKMIIPLHITLLRGTHQRHILRLRTCLLFNPTQIPFKFYKSSCPFKSLIVQHFPNGCCWDKSPYSNTNMLFHGNKLVLILEKNTVILLRRKERSPI